MARNRSKAAKLGWRRRKEKAEAKRLIQVKEIQEGIKNLPKWLEEIFKEWR